MFRKQKSSSLYIYRKEKKLGIRVLFSEISTGLDYLFIAFLQIRRMFRITEKVVTVYLQKRKNLLIEDTIG
jgi:hypothetical protein